jgi:hypothetical protein
MNTCIKCAAERFGKDLYCSDCRRELFHASLAKKPTCSKCGKNPHASNSAWCNPCKNIYQRALKKKNPGRWYRELTPIQKRKRQVRMLIYGMIKLGIMSRKPCESCGEMKVEAHHHKGYGGPNAMDIQWLCKRCHVAADTKLNLTGGRKRTNGSSLRKQS